MLPARPKAGQRDEKVTRYHNAYLRCAVLNAESNQLTAWRNAAGGSIADLFRSSLTRWRRRQLGEEQLAALVQESLSVAPAFAKQPQPFWATVLSRSRIRRQPPGQPRPGMNAPIRRGASGNRPVGLGDWSGEGIGTLDPNLGKPPVGVFATCKQKRRERPLTFMIFLSILERAKGLEPSTRT
jgi:hypothetical protein